MNYPNPKDNPARQALTRAVDRAIANGSPVFVNVPARTSSVDKVIADNTSTANWCNVMGVLDSTADYIGAYDVDAYDLLCAHIEAFPLRLSEPMKVYKIHCNTRLGLWEVMLETLSTGEWTRVFSATNKDTCKSWVRDNPIR